MAMTGNSGFGAIPHSVLVAVLIDSAPKM